MIWQQLYHLTEYPTFGRDKSCSLAQIVLLTTNIKTQSIPGNTNEFLSSLLVNKREKKFNKLHGLPLIAMIPSESKLAIKCFCLKFQHFVLTLQYLTSSDFYWCTNAFIHYLLSKICLGFSICSLTDQLIQTF